jgi:tetratricopeptide (TPR) repeat protein
LPSQIAAWIVQLGDDDPDKRQAAFNRLKAAGEYAEGALEKATQHDDAEIKRQARNLVADFRRGIYPDTPDDVVELVTKYESAADKRTAIRKLIAAGPHGCRALVKLARSEKDPLTRKEVFVAVLSQLGAAVPALMEFNNLAALESLMELVVQGDVSLAATHFAAFHLLNGSLTRQIAQIEEQPKTRREYELLVYLHRANGDLDKALAAAKKADRDELVASVLYEKGDWKALNDNPKLIDSSDRARYLGYRAAYARLVGDEKSFLAVIKEMLDLAKTIEQSKGNLHPLAKAFWLNGRHTDALALFTKRQTAIKLQYDLMAARFQFADAAKVAEDAVKNRYADHQVIELAHARTLHGLGEKDKALAILKRHTEQLKHSLDSDWPAALVETELAIGRREQAFAVAVKILSTRNDGALSARVFDKLFGDRAEEAASLWTLLLRPPNKRDHPAAMKTLRELLDGKGTKQDVERLIAGASNTPQSARQDQESAHWIAAGDAAVRCGQESLAADCFRKAKALRGTLRLGDMEAKKAEWLKASILYLQAYKQGLKELAQDKVGYGTWRESDAALALYLYGHALVNAGFERDGRRRMEQAHLLPLGNSELRFHLMRELSKRGFQQAAAREQLYLRRLSEAMLIEPYSYGAEGFRYAGLDLVKKDPLKAADEFEKSFLRVLQPDLNFGRNVAYVTVPAYLFRVRAVGLAKAGRYDDALHEAKRCGEVQPGDVDLARQLIPLLEAGKRKNDADELYKTTKAVYEAIVKDHPKSALALNQLAWLAATCRRDLKDGLASARKAVELAPDNAGYYDTLAEVLFQLGKKDDAIEAQKKAIKLEPKRAEFVKQLKRIEAGDPKAPREEE